MFPIDDLDVEAIATALADQADYDHRWLVDPRTAEVVLWTEDTGVDGENPVDLEELDLIPIDPLPSYVWYGDMADFARGISDVRVSQRLQHAIKGRGAFRRFRDEVYERHPDLISTWHAFRDVRAHRRAVWWLADQGLVSEAAARQFDATHADPDLP